MINFIVVTSCLASFALAGSIIAADTDGKPRDLKSRAPKYTFASDLSAQETQLRENPLMQRFRDARRKAAGDAFRPAYHFASPEGPLNDPNGVCWF